MCVICNTDRNSRDTCNGITSTDLAAGVPMSTLSDSFDNEYATMQLSGCGPGQDECPIDYYWRPAHGQKHFHYQYTISTNDSADYDE